MKTQETLIADSKELTSSSIPIQYLEKSNYLMANAIRQNTVVTVYVALITGNQVFENIFVKKNEEESSSTTLIFDITYTNTKDESHKQFLRNFSFNYTIPKNNDDPLEIIVHANPKDLETFNDCPCTSTKRGTKVIVQSGTDDEPHFPPYHQFPKN